MNFFCDVASLVWLYVRTTEALVEFLSALVAVILR